jgi:hypothetical protein
MNHGKHVTTEEVSTSANLLPKYLEEKIKSKYISGFLPKFAVLFGTVEHVRPSDIYIGLYRHNPISGRTCLTLVGSVQH